MKQDKFFNLEKELLYIQKEFELDSYYDAIYCFNGGRNIGKTTSTWRFAEIFSLKESGKILYLRNTQEQLKSAIRDLNNKFYNKYYFTQSHIYEIIHEHKETKDGEVVDIYTKGKVVGYCASVSAFDKLKSIEAGDLNMIIYEEYNEDSGRSVGIYNKFINLITTCIRFNKNVIIVMLGNRDSANNDFMVNWGIEPREDTKEDTIYQFSKRGFFIEIGDDTFTGLGNEETLFYELAQFDRKSKRYLGGGYINDFKTDVVNYDKRVAETAKRMFYLNNGEYFEVGKFDHWRVGESIYIHNVEQIELDKKLNIINSTYQASMNAFKNSKTMDDDLVDIAEFFYKYSLGKKLFFTSFDAKIMVEDWINGLLNTVKDKI